MLLNIAHKMPFKFSDGRLHQESGWHSELASAPRIHYVDARKGKNWVGPGTRPATSELQWHQFRHKPARKLLGPVYYVHSFRLPLIGRRTVAQIANQYLKSVLFPCSPKTNWCSTASVLVKESTRAHFDLYNYSVRRSYCYNWPWSELGWAVAANRFVFYWLCIENFLTLLLQRNTFVECMPFV